MARTDIRFREAFNALLDICSGLEGGASLPSENTLAQGMGVSRTVVRAGLQRLSDESIILWDGRAKTLLRRPDAADWLELRDEAPDTDALETRFLEWVLRFDVPAGTTLNVAQLSREFSVAPRTLQEFLAGLSRFGLVERRQRGGWRLLGFTADFAVELSEFRTVLELNAVRQLVALPPGHEIWPRLEALRARHLALAARVETHFHDFSKLDEAFHTTVTGVVKNRFVAEFQKVISLIFHYHYTWDKTEEKARNAAAIAEHLTWIEAMLARDAPASKAAALRHLRTSKTTLLSSMHSHRLA
ncbi:GntR family transcriptional regulator [Paroceanicella profunda]|uniref:GntR family transcriptional regulator n=1 Tax=Paroceanicella profunda TaxID=2579971 RepID=A0A5B8FGU6_9RHOB|nr:GntR family transcriptional regulator [Paroceanicella profunda]QDL91651.1 GntR family transcriptional regulator [Paroceanicella profunda]